MPAYHQLIYNRLALTGFPAGYMPPVMVLSAQAAAQAPMECGGPDFHHLLAGTDAADAPLIRRAKLGRAAVDLAQLAAHRAAA